MHPLRRLRGTNRRSVLTLAFLVTLAAALSAPAATPAATVSTDGAGNLSYVAAPGEINWPGVAVDDPQSTGTLQWRVIDTQATMTPLMNCATYSGDTHDILCTRGPTATLDLGDRDDQLVGVNPQGPAPLTVTAFGGPGNDLVIGSADGGLWILDGGEGEDQVSLERASLTGTAGLIAAAGDYQLYGGPGPDKVLGVIYPEFAVAERQFGGDGDDTVDGFGGNDQQYGAAGADGMNGGEGDDTVDGGDGDDEMSGAAGVDTLLGGAGNDKVDALDTSPTADEIDCGPGTADQAIGDTADSIPLSCERVGNYFEFCPMNATGCSGTVTLTGGGGGAGRALARSLSPAKKKQILGKGRFTIEHGQQLAPGAKLRRKGRKLVKKRGTLRIKVRVETKIKRPNRKPKIHRHSGFVKVTKG